MPGGFCRISEREDARRHRDVARHPVRRRLGAGGAARSGAADRLRARRRGCGAVGGNLPSRAADGLFWLGRYLERAEAVIRLVLAHLRSVGDAVGADISRRPRHPGGPGAARAPARVGQHRRGRPPTARLAQEALAGRERSGSARAHIVSARRNAAALRARLSGEAWRVLADLTGSCPSSTERALHRVAARRPRRAGAEPARRPVGPDAREHEPGGGLALRRARPAHRAGGQHLHLRAAPSPTTRRPRAASG